MDDIVIEAEQPDNSPAVDAVVRQTFAHHPEVADMVTAIRQSPRYRSGLALVARRADRVVGFVMLSGTDLVEEDGTCREVLTLTPLAVAPDFERRGIGSALVRGAVDAADRLREPLVVLEGSPGYYGRLGFRYAPDYGITIDLPDWAHREAAQVLLLSNYQPVVRGHIRYPAAIAAASA